MFYTQQDKLPALCFSIASQLFCRPVLFLRWREYFSKGLLFLPERTLAFCRATVSIPLVTLEFNASTSISLNEGIRGGRVYIRAVKLQQYQQLNST